ncbi:MAG: AAA family ATPase [Thermoproteales archaeon]|nr:AAA family ATPase [Thermoproteales archaeon]RLE67301.1 MAG: hypothetical protein DRJ47_00315 [Thermoprotei archaeon]
MKVQPLVKEVIIENFMSYRYARIGFQPGLNIITGPNGAGKSSILLAIAVALGQTYTERGRRLSDLIRRGEEIARVTVVLDNSPRNRIRPLPRWRYNEIYLTRYLRSDGKYWHELNNTLATKYEINRLLNRIGLNPDNMFIIMHQNMIEEFVYLSPQEKLRLIEDAVGLKGYRDAIVKSMQRLEHTLSEEEKIKELLKKAEEKFENIKQEHEKYLRKLELEEIRGRLRLEAAWIKVRDLEHQTNLLKEEINALLQEKKKTERKIVGLRDSIDYLKAALKDIEKDLIDGFINKVSLEDFLSLLNKYKDTWNSYLNDYSELKLSKYVLKILNEKIASIETELRELSFRLEVALKQALTLGERVESQRKIEEVEEELKKIELELAGYRGISREVEELYKRYLGDLNRLREKALIVARNREKVLKELEYRKNIWKSKLIKLISDVRRLFSSHLSHVEAVGDVRLINLDDIEQAGIEITVGFRGSAPTVLDPYTQSGGERTTAIMCFLLALQQYIRSPFRAVDEFDVHMDPKNREAVFNLIFRISEQHPDVQYLVITPGTLINLVKTANVVVVQNVKGVSKVGTLR